MPTIIDRFAGKYSFLSNFSPSPLTQPTVEHCFQAAKCALPEEAEKIMKADSPGLAKSLGRRAKLRADWEYARYPTMLALVTYKFCHPGLRELLIETGDAELIEGNYWHDNYWGACWCEKCKDEPKHNTLGKILMKVRRILNEQY